MHHSAGSNTSSDWAGTVRAIWDFHSRPETEGGRGWGDVGYNYLIDPNGVIYEGRAGGDNVIGAHFSCRNGGTMGVCLLGTFQTSPPSAAALESLKRLLAWKAAQRQFMPLEEAHHTGTGLTLARVCGHRDANPSYPEEACSTTSCPGERLYGSLANIRTEVQAIIEAAAMQPLLTALAPTEVTVNTARLWGQLESEGGNPVLEWRFEWGTEGSFTRWTTAVFPAGTAFFADAGNLDRDTEYQFRFAARTSAGWSSSEPQFFRTRTSLAISFDLGTEGSLEVFGQPGTPLIIQASPDLLEWQPIRTSTIPANGVLRLQLNIGSLEKSFLRAIVP